MKVQDFYGALAKKAGTTKVGKFVLKDVPARTMRNPFTGQDIETRAYRTIQFKTAYAMRADAETAKKGKK